MPAELCGTGNQESSSSALVWMCSFLPSAAQGEASRCGEAAAYRGMSAFGEQRGCLTQARRALHKGGP